MDWLHPQTLPPLASVACLALSVAWDRYGGEPPSRLHPVVWIGNIIDGMRRLFEPMQRAHLLLGLVIALLVPTLAYACASWTTHWVLWLQLPMHVFLLKSTFSLWTLLGAADRMHALLMAGPLAEARGQLSWLCSRDSSNLTTDELATATVESVAENLSDSLVAPLFYYGLFGLPGALSYRAINTADAMIGYHGRYEYLGKAAARLDDLVNFIPARLTGLLLLLAGAARRASWRTALSTWRQEAGQTESPNAGVPMATMAGLLAARLDKPGHYVLGKDFGPVTLVHLSQATAIARRAGQLAIGGCLLWLSL